MGGLSSGFGGAERVSHPPNTAMSHRLRAAAPHPERGGGVRGAGPAGARRRQLPHVPGPALPGEPGGDTRAPSPPLPSHPRCSSVSPPPQNGGICEDAESSTYVCRCPHGFTGSNCEYSQALHCHPGGCPPCGDITRCPPCLDAAPPPALTAHLCPLPGQRRADLMPPASTGRMGRATAAAATWASLGRGAPKVSTAGDRARGWEPSGDRGTGVGTTLEMRVWGWDHSGDRGTRVGTTPGRWTWGTQV